MLHRGWFSTFVVSVLGHLYFGWGAQPNHSRILVRLALPTDFLLLSTWELYFGTSGVPHAHVVNRSLQRYAQSTLFYFSGCLGNLLITQGYCWGCALWLCAVDVSWWLRAVAVIIVGVCVFVTMFVVVLVFVVVCCGCVFVAVCCGCVCV